MTGHRLLGMTGKVRVEIIGACPEDCLGLLAVQGIRFRDYVKKDPLTAEVTLGRRDFGAVEAAAKKAMCECSIVSFSGVLPAAEAMGKRLGYPFVLGLIVVLVLWMQGHILFFQVQGNEHIPTEQILAVLEENQIGFWTSTKELELNWLKNRVLAQIPELEFITINLEGPVATVVVRERQEKPEKPSLKAPANVIATKCGIVERITTTGGTPQVKPGDVVTEGQLLISGVTNLDRTLMLTRGEGEITARTFVRNRAVSGSTQLQKQYTGREKRCFSITFGKNTINFYKTSGISYDNYDRMTVRKPLTLPGGYKLPVSLSFVSIREYTLGQIPLEESEVQVQLTEAVCRDTQEKLSAGMILEVRTSVNRNGDAFYLTGTLECREDVGKVVEIQD